MEISIAPTPELTRTAFAYFGIELGGVLKMRPDGGMAFDTEAPDLAQVLSILTGQILADHVTATMVLPSNVKALQDALRALRAVSASGALSGTYDYYGEVEESIERIESVVENLDGLMAANPKE